MLSDLRSFGFDVQTENHATAILTRDFPVPLRELCEVLSEVQIADVELIRGGGGEAAPTQRLRRALNSRNWKKRNVVIRKTVDGQERSSITHEIDHVRRTNKGSVALEIEWNNKDPFFDRDLENFQRLHSEGAISVGVIVTRGRSLQNSLKRIVFRCAQNHQVQDFDDLTSLFGLNPTPRQRRRVRSTGDDFSSEWSRMFVQDKFGSSTTHWGKLQDRIGRGVGSPCPLVLLGIPDKVIHEA